VKIALVAENGFMRTSIQVNIQSEGYEFTGLEPYTLYDVLARLRDVHPHLVILDQDIPRCNCETLVRSIREDPVLAPTPILVILEQAEDPSVSRMRRWRRVAFLPRPLQVEALLEAVQHHNSN